MPLRSSLILGLLAVLLVSGCATHAGGIAEEAEAAWRAGKYERAIELNIQVIAREGASDEAARALLNIGSIYYRNLRRIPEAVETYNRLAQEYPGSPQELRARMDLAEIYANEMVDPTQAISEYDRILALPGLDNPAEIQFLRADAYFKKEDFDRALRELQHILESGAGGHLADQSRLKIGNIYQIQRRYEEALAVFELVSHSPCQVCRRRAILNLMETYESLYDFDRAVAAVRRLDGTPENADRIREEVARLEDKRRRLNSAQDPASKGPQPLR